MNELDAWVAAACAELGLRPEDVSAKAVLDVARDVAHQVLRPGAPVSAYLMGVAVGRGADPSDVADRLSALALAWPSRKAGGESAGRHETEPTGSDSFGRHRETAKAADGEGAGSAVDGQSAGRVVGGESAGRAADGQSAGRAVGGEGVGEAVDGRSAGRAVDGENVGRPADVGGAGQPGDVGNSRSRAGGVGDPPIP